jgi:hypothetical protein
MVAIKSPKSAVLPSPEKVLNSIVFKALGSSPPIYNALSSALVVYC